MCETLGFFDDCEIWDKLSKTYDMLDKLSNNYDLMDKLSNAYDLLDRLSNEYVIAIGQNVKRYT